MKRLELHTKAAHFLIYTPIDDAPVEKIIEEKSKENPLYEFANKIENRRFLFTNVIISGASIIKEFEKNFDISLNVTKPKEKILKKSLLMKLNRYSPFKMFVDEL